MGIAGNGADFAMLEAANVQDCDIFIAMTQYDEVNMVSAVLAKKWEPKKPSFVFVTLNIPTLTLKKKYSRFSLIVNPELLAARAIANIIDFPNALSVERFAGGLVSLMEFKVRNFSNICQMSIADFRKKFGNVIVCAVERDHKLMIPSGIMILEDQDRIFVTGSRVDMMLFHNYIKSRVVKSLLIIGAGKIAYYLLGMLKDSRIDTKVIEVNPERAAFFSEKFPKLYIVQGDGTTKDTLLEESAQNYDAVATLTGVDEENIITSMFLDNIGVQKNITKVNRTAYWKSFMQQISQVSSLLKQSLLIPSCTLSMVV